MENNSNSSFQNISAERQLKGLFQRYFPDFLLLVVWYIGLNIYLSFFIFGLIFLRCVSKGLKTRIDLGFVILILSLLFFVITGVSAGNVEVSFAIVITFFSIFSYIFGQSYFQRCRNYTDFFFILFLFSLIPTLVDIPVTIFDVFNNGLINPERKLSVLGSPDDQRSVAGRTVELTIAISGVFMLFIKPTSKTDLRLRKYFIILAAVAEICALHYVSRTGVAVLIISFGLGLILKYGWSKKTIYVLLVVGIFVYLLQGTSLADVYASREEVEGFEMTSAGGRSDRWIFGLAAIFANPNGYSLTEFYYAHNFWIDYGIEGGLYAFLLMSLFSIYELLVSVRIFRRKFIPDHIRYTVLIFSVIYAATFFTEPIHRGSTNVMNIYFMFSAMVFELNHLTKKQRLNRLSI